MHIPEHMLQETITPITTCLGIAGVCVATYFVNKSKEKIDILKFGIVTSFIFLLQMLNFPISNGTSGHFVGTSLLIFLFGIPQGILGMSIILTIQAIFFADGGILTLGANIFNMAIVGAIPAAIVYRYKNKILYFIAAYFSTVLAAISCSLVLAFSYPDRALNIFYSMVSIHGIIAIFEAIITLINIYLLNLIFERTPSTRVKSFTLLGIFILFLLLTPFASNLPDGLEWVAEKYNFLKENEVNFVNIFPDYSFPLIEHNMFSTIIAGLVGVIITLAFSYGLIYILKFKKMTEKKVKEF